MKNHLISALFASTCLTTANTVWTQANWAASDAAVPVVADGLSGGVTSSKGPETDGLF